MSDILAVAMATFPAQKRMMFGCPAYFIYGNMFTGVHQSSIILRLPEADRNSILQQYDEAAPFEPFPGRFMREYIAIPAAVYDDPGAFRSWLDKAAKYAAAMPPKTPKTKTVTKEKPYGPR